MSVTVSVIVLNYKSGDDLPACLGGLLEQSFTDFEILLVDQGQKDGSTEAMQRAFERPFQGRLKVIWAGRNRGFSGGCNLGFRRARGKWVALLNADAIPDENWLKALLKGTETSDNIGMCATRLRLLTQPGFLDNIGHHLYPDGLNVPVGRGQKDGPQFDEPREVLCPSGAAGLYLLEAVRKVGGFDDAFFAYGEDLDLGLSLQALGYRCLYCPDAIARHALSATWGRLSLRKAYYVERNRIWVALRHFPPGAIAALPGTTLFRHILTLKAGFQGHGPLGSIGEDLDTAPPKDTPGSNTPIKGAGARIGAWTRLALAGGAVMSGQVAAILGARSQLRARQTLQKKGAYSRGDYLVWLKEFGMGAVQASEQWLDGPID